MLFKWVGLFVLIVVGFIVKKSWKLDIKMVYDLVDI